MQFRPLSDEQVNLAISRKKLDELFNRGELCADEVRCLDATSKATLWSVCLQASVFSKDRESAKTRASSADPDNLFISDFSDV